MPIQQCMDTHTHRQYLTWLAWLDHRDATPDPTQYYLMQIAAEVRRVLAKQPNSIKLDHFELQFGTVAPQIADPELELKQSKHRWNALLGMGSNDGSRN